MKLAGAHGGLVRDADSEAHSQEARAAWVWDDAQEFIFLTCSQFISDAGASGTILKKIALPHEVRLISQRSDI